MVEPITGFASIVGLISSFAAGRDAHEKAEVQEFFEWLSEHNFDEVRKALEQNQKSTIEIKAVLSVGLDELNRKLDHISQDLARLGSLPEEFVRLADVLGQDKSELSDQALEILRIFTDSEIQRCYTVQYLSEEYPTIDFYPKKIDWSPKEPQYLEQDLAHLSEAGYFEYTEREHNKEYQLTRPGAAKAAELLLARRVYSQ